ncbi:hypothetical protein PCASD_17083 [Puccinia coronata f. sp. avenae]|uniref:Uncharacterized protein n=1 Tax=Puccinia coronata f. sp. avenae TaxID=200324 RepID=A0A2N5TR00_9BASI|nr:hypothetical protein PCASD_17083 [Puccinia coronata f. sp. avenae]
MASPASPSSSSSHPLRPYYQPTDTQQQPLINHWLSAPAPASSSSLLPQPQLATTTRTGAPRTYLIPPECDDMHRHGPLPDQPHRFSPLLRGYLWAGYIAWTGTAMAMPFEVGKTLLQVQWIPATDTSPLRIPPDDYLEQDDEEEEQEEDNDNLDTYFTQVKPPPRPSIGSTISKRTTSGTGSVRGAGTGVRSRRGEVWPEWMLPVVVERGVGEMMRAVSGWRGEGILGLWKGQLTACVMDTVSAKVQPVVQALLMLVCAAPAAASLPLEHQAYPGLPLALAVGSSLATGLLLAPLDLVRTRLIVQSSQLRHRTYTGPVDALRTIIRTEGGLRNLFLHPALLAPALLENLLRPLLHLATPLAIDRLLGLDRAQEPVRYGLAELGFSCAALLLILPLETVRKRLQLQSRAPPSPTLPSSSSSNTDHPKPFKPCVRLRPKPYNGIVDALYRIVTEEKAGVWGLFRGFNVGITANFVVFVLSVLGNQSLLTHDPTHLHDAAAGRFGSGGWAEV